VGRKSKSVRGTGLRDYHSQLGWAAASLQMQVMSIVLDQRLVGAHFLSVLKVPGT